MTEEDLLPMWKAAQKWLTVWAGAGFTGRVEGHRILMPAGWKERFPDGPMILGALRTELFGLIRDGNRAIPPNPARQRAYIEHLEALLAEERKRLGLAEKCVQNANKAICDLEIELAEATNPRKP